MYSLGLKPITKYFIWWSTIGIRSDLYFLFQLPVFGSGSVSNYSLRLIGRALFHSYGLDYYELTVRRLSTDRGIPFLIKIKLTIENVKLKLQKSYNSEVLLHKHKKKIHLTVASERKHRLGENEYGVDDTQPGDIELTVELYVSSIDVSHTVNKKTSTILTNYLSVQNTDVPLYKDLRTLSKDFQSLFAIKTPMLHDVAIKIGDLIISADKAILAARSSELANKIQESKLACDGVTFIEISDFEPKLVNMMLEYIYSAQLPSMDNPTAMDMYKIAVDFKMETMKTNVCVFCNPMSQSKML
ncbi:hypothetical protein CEXT_500811 [Caerostris extrusa]|uniref:BTB domain-containing protein n=1 Tax=Caerostris extrusa TaxID=172846 RepID=A0AAV4MUT0_CAEEX|nr:hypothetical protein CEXT_500811 [Caerostris extrusa]